MNLARGLMAALTRVSPRTIYFYSIAIGACAGVGAIVFNRLLHLTERLAMGGIAGLPVGEASEAAQSAGTHDLLVVLLPILGGLVAGLLVKGLAPEAEGTGTDGYIESFHHKGGRMRRRVPLIKSLATLATLSTGGSAGKEGPVAQIGSGVGAMLGAAVRMGDRARRTLLLVGAAGGLGAIFKAPLGGALTAVEVLYKEDFETDALIPCILSSVSAYTVFCSVQGFGHVFAFENATFRHPRELPVYALLGLLCSAVGFLYVKLFHGLRARVFNRLPVSKWLVPPIGGLLVGLVGLLAPEAMGQGVWVLQRALAGNLVEASLAGAGVLLLLAGAKILTTSFTISSGGSGGVFAPSLFIGGMLGGAVGIFGNLYLPSVVTDIGPYVVVGMASFFAGVANAPVASMVMVCELTGAWELMAPLMIVGVIALVLTKRWSIYTSQVENRFHSPAHVWEMNPELLTRMTVGQTMAGSYHREAVIADSTGLSDLLELAEGTGEQAFIVEGDGGRLEGLIVLRALELDEAKRGLGNLVVAHDLITRRPFAVRPEDSLIRVLQLLSESDFPMVPVVASGGTAGGRLLGYLCYGDVLSASTLPPIRTPPG